MYARYEMRCNSWVQCHLCENEMIRDLNLIKNRGGVFCANSVNYLLVNQDIEYFLALCNSKVINWFFKKLSTNSNVNGYEIDNLPILIADESQKIQIKQIVEKIINITSIDVEKELLEKQLNSIIYGIYGITEEEIRVIEATIK